MSPLSAITHEMNGRHGFLFGIILVYGRSRVYAGKISSAANRIRMPSDIGRQVPLSRPSRLPASRNITACRCFPIRLASCTWGMCAITRLAMCCRATAHAGLQRVAANGLGCFRPACGERGDAKQRTSRAVDLRQYRLHAQADCRVWGWP